VPVTEPDDAPSVRERSTGRIDRVAGILLAAGTSSRMGTNKLLLEIAGEPLVARAARQALEGGLDPLVVVLGHEAERVRAAIAHLACLPVVNPDFAAGQPSSVAAGIGTLPADTDAVVILLADMPFVTGEIVAGLVERRRASGARIVLTRYGDVQAPPALYDRSLFGELSRMTDGRCGREVIARHRDEAEALVWPAERLADLDVPEDLAAVRALAAALD
jgi:molybdenum cofactor cytidylyltransferase